MNRDVKKIIGEFDSLIAGKKLSSVDHFWDSDYYVLEEISIGPVSGKIEDFLLAYNAYKLGFMLGVKSEKRNAKKRRTNK